MTKLYQVKTPLADLSTATEPLATQLLYGELFEVEKIENNIATGRRVKDGYVGQINLDCLSPDIIAATHVIDQRGSYILSAAKVTSKSLLRLPFMAQIHVLDDQGENEFVPVRIHGLGAEKKDAWISKKSLTPIYNKASDFVKVAETLLNAPYLYGGCGDMGLDCSALVQLSLARCGINVPRNSGDQAKSVGQALDIQAPRQRGDLVFFKGHVGIMIDAENMIHANASAMCVSVDNLNDFTKKLQTRGGGGIIALRRLEKL